jgi:hypothetical protein
LLQHFEVIDENELGGSGSHREHHTKETNHAARKTTSSTIP